MTTANTVDVRPRLRLPREVVAKLDELSLEEKSRLIVQAMTEPNLDQAMTAWHPGTLQEIAHVLDDVAEGRLRWVPQTENEERPAYLFQPHFLAGWAGLLRETAEKGKV